VRLKPDVKSVIDWAVGHGWVFEGLTKSDHFALRYPDKDAVVYLPQSPSDWRSMRNVKAKIREVSGIPSESGPAAKYRHESRRPRFDMREVLRERRERAAREAAEALQAEAEAVALAEAAWPIWEQRREALADIGRCDPRRDQQRLRILAAKVLDFDRALKHLTTE
jgi:hypothetical protein